MPEPSPDPPREPEPSPGMQLANGAVDALRRAAELLHFEGRLDVANFRAWQAFSEGYVVMIEELEK